MIGEHTLRKTQIPNGQMKRGKIFNNSRAGNSERRRIEHNSSVIFSPPMRLEMRKGSGKPLTRAAFEQGVLLQRTCWMIISTWRRKVVAMKQTANFWRSHI